MRYHFCVGFKTESHVDSSGRDVSAASSSTVCKVKGKGLAGSAERIAQFRKINEIAERWYIVSLVGVTDSLRMDFEL